MNPIDTVCKEIKTLKISGENIAKRILIHWGKASIPMSVFGFGSSFELQNSWDG